MPPKKVARTLNFNDAPSSSQQQHATADVPGSTNGDQIATNLRSASAQSNPQNATTVAAAPSTDDLIARAMFPISSSSQVLTTPAGSSTLNDQELLEMEKNVNKQEETLRKIRENKMQIKNEMQQSQSLLR